MKLKTFSQGINEAITTAMEIDDSLINFGLGVTDPKGVFGTTSGLEERFGSERVFDMPTSENAMTGVAIGATLGGIKSVMTHQRIDFFLLAMDQLVNGAAKWYYMFGSQTPIPITIRLIIGRGWGQGPTHSQNLQSWFAHIPGLKVVMPSSPSDGKGLLLSSIFDPNPVVFLEHRWLHNSEGEIPEGDFRVPLSKANIIIDGKDITLVTTSYMTVEAIHAVDFLKRFNINCELIDLRTVKPIDWDTIHNSVAKTGALLCVDTGFSTGSIAGEIVARVVEKNWIHLNFPPLKMAMPDVPEPTSIALTKGFYIRARDIVLKVNEILDAKLTILDSDLKEPVHHDVPGDWFKGPF